MDILKRQFPIKSLIFLKSNCHAKMAPDTDAGRRKRRRIPEGQDRDVPLLCRARVAGGRGMAPRSHGRRCFDLGARGGIVLGRSFQFPRDPVSARRRKETLLMANIARIDRERIATTDERHPTKKGPPKPRAKRKRTSAAAEAPKAVPPKRRRTPALKAMPADPEITAAAPNAVSSA